MAMADECTPNYGKLPRAGYRNVPLGELMGQGGSVAKEDKEGDVGSLMNQGGKARKSGDKSQETLGGLMNQGKGAR